MSDQKQNGWWHCYRSWKAGLSRWGRWRWRLLRVAMVLFTASLLLLAAYSSFVRQPEIPPVPVDKTPPSVSISTTPDSSVSTSGPETDGRRVGVYTILVVGRDTGGGGNTDTMILATYDTKNKTINAMSLPRDTMTNVSWNNKKLNTVYNYYKGRDKATQVEKGMTALKSHVCKLTGILPDYYVMVEWAAVGELVEAIGGITFNVPYDMHYDDPEQDLHIHQTKGERRLSGSDAMEVIRWRKNNGEYGNFQVGDAGRMKIQQNFLMAVARECLQLKHLKSADKFARIFTEHVSTDLTVGNLVWLAQQAIGMDVEAGIRFCTMPYSPYSRNTAYVLPVVDELLTIVNRQLNPYTEAISTEDLEVLLLNKDGSMSLTSGTLADSSLAKPRTTQSTKLTQVEEVAKPEQSVPLQGETASQPEQTPEQTEPKPDVSQTGGETTQTTRGTDGVVNLLPARPVPVQ